MLLATEMRKKEIWWPHEENDPPYILGEKWYSREEREEMSRKLVYGTLLSTLDKTAEMAAAWNNAPPIPIKDMAEFRLLSKVSTRSYWRHGTTANGACTLSPGNTATTVKV
ncbi:MAG: hypothetical protein P4L49_06695 [Desulfosporosinus sp.]|nr:hypothetical protein [Desulfosporosinus sp.]